MTVMRKMVLEGHRFGAVEAHAERLVDVIAPRGDDVDVKNAPATTLEAAVQLAGKIAPKAAKDAIGSNKVRTAHKGRPAGCLLTLSTPLPQTTPRIPARLARPIPRHPPRTVSQV